MITILKGKNFKLEVDRKEITDISPSPDGIVFQFIGGTHLYHVDPNLPIDIKEKIKLSFLTFEKGDIVINLTPLKPQDVVTVTL